MQFLRSLRGVAAGALCVFSLAAAPSAHAKVAVGATAPNVTLQNQDGKTVSLADRKGKGWTVLYFYPKAGTPGCTTQACAFRDAIKVIQAKNAEVYGISADTVSAQKKFHKEHRLTFDLLADPKDEAISAYGVKRPGSELAKRWTFILDPNLVVRNVARDVDPLLDAKNCAAKLDKLQKQAAASSKAAKKHT